VLFRSEFWPGIRDGTITTTFRRWRRTQVVAGRRYRTPAGMIEVDAVAIVDPAAISDDDARRSGFDSAAAAVAALRAEADLSVFRIDFHLVCEPDPREVLAAEGDLSDDAAAEIGRRLARLDRASRHGPWTHAVLLAIAQHPGRRAAELAATFGRETQPFKTDVRKLKNLGLTISLDVGYRLSRRGEAYLARRQ